MTVDGKHYVLSLIYIPDPQGKQDQELAHYLDHLEKEFSRLSSENILLRRELANKHKHGPMIGRSQAFMETMSVVERVATTDATVLILGETGTGKELLARRIHDISKRHDHPLIKVNCAALPHALMESELFGHARGAFTSAVETQVGRFESAQHGTIFLDEIGELPLELQAKLLRVLQEKEMNRIGDNRTIKVDVRIIAATNRDLQQEVLKATFRSDLYYRLNVLPITSPPLRDRSGDIPLLVQHFLDRANRKFGKQVEIIPKATMNKLCAYSWPGNIRELENLIERAVILSTDRILELGDTQSISSSPTEGVERLMTLQEIEKDYVVKILKKTGWRVSGERGAAKILGLNPKTLESRMKKMGICRPDLSGEKSLE
ncbi:sigma-54 interaction domain-containing protein [Desulfovibrio inopinatus]|uniref:sigma-54 interaction domain-containing protein n=1 Tax=Desulfovibrio inopinatus TaxID=102109 RepID=UPI001FE13AA9|nr:sigma 54-interacting transcriptional regulator [Desulfovibrio inopinatus]